MFGPSDMPKSCNSEAVWSQARLSALAAKQLGQEGFLAVICCPHSVLALLTKSFARNCWSLTVSLMLFWFALGTGQSFSVAVGVLHQPRESEATKTKPRFEVGMEACMCCSTDGLSSCPTMRDLKARHLIIFGSRHCLPPFFSLIIAGKSV